jgi:hypothetical protein
MEETVLSWTVPNWITVCLMALLGFAVLSLAGRALAKVKAGASSDAAA